MRTGPILFAAAVLVAAEVAARSQPAAIFDPQQLPATEGQVAQYSLTPRGDVDGVILQDGTQVHLPPHLGPQLVQAVKPGDAVTIHGLKAQALPLMQALSITGNASKQTLVDAGPPAAPPQPLATSFQWARVQGSVHEPLYGPRGEMNGALLEDGTQVHLPPNQASALRQSLQAGRTLVAQGYLAAGPYGRSLAAQQIGESAAKLVEVGPAGPRDRQGPPAPPAARAPLSAPSGLGAPPPPPPPSGGPDTPPPPPRG